MCTYKACLWVAGTDIDTLNTDIEVGRWSVDEAVK